LDESLVSDPDAFHNYDGVVASFANRHAVREDSNPDERIQPATIALFASQVLVIERRRKWRHLATTKSRHGGAWRLFDETS
jgi:hypothetical protein